MGKDDETLVMRARDLRAMLRVVDDQRAFMLGDSFTPDNIVEIAKSQFPRLEAQVAIARQLEQTKRLLIIVAGICLIAGGALVVFAPTGKEGVSLLSPQSWPYFLLALSVSKSSAFEQSV